MLKLRVIVNGKHIVELNHRQPAIIPCTGQSTSIVVSNGFHFSRTLELSCNPPAVYIYRVDCQIDNIRMFTGIFISLLLFSMYIFIGSTGFMVAANLPILYMLYVFYAGRKEFITLDAIWKF